MICFSFVPFACDYGCQNFRQVKSIVDNFAGNRKYLEKFPMQNRLGKRFNEILYGVEGHSVLFMPCQNFRQVKSIGKRFNEILYRRPFK